MDKTAILILGIVMATLLVSVGLGMRYSVAVLLYGGIALVLSPLALHKIEKMNVAIGVLVGLAIFASFPARKLYQLDGILDSAGLTIAYGIVLFIAGFGWKRDWKAKG